MAGAAGLIAGRHVAPDEFADLGLDGGAIERHAAVGPLDAAVAAGDVRLGENDEAALEAAALRHLLDAGVGGVLEGVVDAHHEVRRGGEVAEAILDQRHDLGERLGRH